MSASPALVSSVSLTNTAPYISLCPLGSSMILSFSCARQASHTCGADGGARGNAPFPQVIVRPPRVLSFVEQPGALQEVGHSAHDDAGGFSAGVKTDADERVWRGRGEAGKDVHRQRCTRKLGARGSRSDESEKASRWTSEETRASSETPRDRNAGGW